MMEEPVLSLPKGAFGHGREGGPVANGLPGMLY